MPDMQVQACFYGANTNQALLILAYPMLRFAALDASGFRMAQSPGRKFRKQQGKQPGLSWNIQ